MERKRRRRWVELGKDLLIAALALTAVYLTLRTQVYTELSASRASGWLGTVLDLVGGTVAPPAQGGADRRRLEVHPLRMAVNLGEVGRYGIQYDQEKVDEAFSRSYSVLVEALGSAGEPAQIGEGEWRQALSGRAGIYFDFEGAVPLAVLCSALDAGENAALPEASVRRVLLCAGDGEDVVLYYSNESDGSYYACRTEEALSRLLDVVSSYSANGVTFAYEGDFGSLEPYVMLGQSGSAGQVRPPVYLASDPVASLGEDRGELLEALGFHVQTGNSYRQGDTLVVNEWPDTLTVSDAGVVTYTTTLSDAPKYPVGTAGEALSALDVAEATQALVERAVQPWLGEGRTALLRLERLADGSWQVDYGYTLGGIPVQLGEDGCAARFLVRGGQVLSFTLHLRNYSAGDETTSVLPDVQAAAAVEALDAGQKELLLSYEDSGAAERLEARWIGK